MTNPLYPAFFRLDRLEMLVVGAGQVGEEKLSFILKSSPNARVTVVAPWMGEELTALLDEYEAQTRVPGESGGGANPGFAAETPAARWHTSAGGRITWFRREFRPDDVQSVDLVVAATNFREVNREVWEAAKSARRLANIADTPALCDFYLGSIVTRGPLKVAISTNGQSPTFAKRFRQWLEAELPAAETADLIDNLKDFRDRLTGDFATKVRELNLVTDGLLSSARAGRRCPPGGCLLAHSETDPKDLAPASPPDTPGSGSENN